MLESFLMAESWDEATVFIQRKMFPTINSGPQSPMISPSTNNGIGFGRNPSPDKTMDGTGSSGTTDGGATAHGTTGAPASGMM